MKCPRCKEVHRWTWTREGQLCGPETLFEGECDDDDPATDDRRFECVSRDAFHINSVHAVYRCKACGSDKFIVGSGQWRTVIKCPRCGWEETIHEG